MKFKFKKIELLVHHRERTQITTILQELGVIHLEIDTDFRNEHIEDLELRKTRLKKVSDFMKGYLTIDSDTQSELPLEKLDVNEVTSKILELRNQVELDQQVEETLHKNRQKFAPWGDFDRDKITKLVESGVQLTFYIADKKEFKKHDFGNLIYQVISEDPDKIYFIVVSKDEQPIVPFEMVELLRMSKKEIETIIEKHKKRRTGLSKTMNAYLPYLPVIHRELNLLHNQLQLQLANGSYKDYGDGIISHLSGWYPANTEDRLLHYLKRENWSYAISNPTKYDKVPVLLNNPGYPKLFETITKIFQLPGYYEMDLTPFIAVFYPILFAYCLGDAGYGLILFTASIVGWFTFMKQTKNLAVLGIILGAFTSLMGVVKSGSIFGLPIMANTTHPLFEFLSQYVIISDDRGVIFNAFNVALMIGVVQIVVGILVSIANRIWYKGFLASISQLGKLFMVVTLIWMFLADKQGVAALQEYPEIRKFMFIVGVLFVLFFHDLKVGVLKRVASGILPLFFILTGILGDVLSYVRLFALGVASSVLGLVVNQIGMQIMGNTWWEIALGILFLFVGHSINLALATLGAFVHPLRLTFVEFYNNAQFEGGGVAYRPFKKIDVSQLK